MDAAVLPLSRRRAGALLRAMSDERLAARVRGGDDGAFAVLYDRHHRGLLAFCRHMLGDREEAEDVLQHVFVSLHRHLCSDARALRVKPWLYTVARNRCLSVLRGRRDALSLETVAEPSTDGLAVAAEVERRQDLRDLLADLRALPDDQRAALLLSELDGLSHRDVAEVLGVRHAKVRALVFQARESLMTSRGARDADCREIREQLATLHGSALRRSALRRHVATCPGCAAFQAEVRRQRSALALVLPVVPGAIVRKAVLGGLAASGGAGGAGGVVAAGGGIAAKLVVVAALVGAAGGGAVAVRTVARDDARPAAAAVPAAAAAAQGSAAAPAPRARPVALAVRRTTEHSVARRGGRPDRGRRVGQGRGRATAPGQIAKGGGRAHGRKAMPPGQIAKGDRQAHGRKATAPGQGRKATAPGQARKATPGQARNGTPPGQARKAAAPAGGVPGPSVHASAAHAPASQGRSAQVPATRGHSGHVPAAHGAPAHAPAAPASPPGRAKRSAGTHR
jgi:RNA polymerase sigma factor (sigma-70 family)